MLICPKCKNQVADNSRFCPYCGATFETSAPQADADKTVGVGSQWQNAYAGQQQNQYQQAGQYQQTGQYQQAGQYQQPTMPVAQLETNRSFIKTLLLSLITFGIYGLIVYAHITDDVNLVCTRYDNKKSMNYYLLYFLVGPLTCGIGMIVWMHNICNRIGNELKRRGIAMDFSASTFWLWNVLGSLIIVGPFIFAYKFFKAVNTLNDSFNRIG